MPARRVDGRLWGRLVHALRPWLQRVLGRLGARGAAPGRTAPTPATGRPGGLPARRAPAPGPPSSPLPLAPPRLPEATVGPYARATWTVRWRPPLLRVPCPRCREPLELPLWRVLYHESVSCEACALLLTRGGGAAPETPR